MDMRKSIVLWYGYCVVLLVVPPSLGAVLPSGAPNELSMENSSTAAFIPLTDNTTVPWPSQCKIMAVDEYMYERVHNLMELNVKLIEYHLNFSNYDVNPLLVNMTRYYKADKWSRVASAHGQTLLSLAFNYGVLSLMTLTMGTELLDAELHDLPKGCFGELTEDEKAEGITHLLLRDFKHDADVLLVDEERVCNEIIVEDGPHASFKDRCCHRHELTSEIICTTATVNIWLQILHALLAIVRFAVLFFGPMLFIPIVEMLSNQNFPYVVKLKDPLYKTICVVKSDTHIPSNYKCSHILDFRKIRGMSKLRMSASDMTLGEPFKVKISEYNLLVDYRKLLPENNVPVGLWSSISRAIFLCKLKDVGPFKRCCKANMLSMFSSTRAPVPWIKLWKKVGRLLMILFMPTPFYIRLIIYYVFEIDELSRRQDAATNIGLKIPYDKSLLHFLSPTHPLFISMYCLYFVTAIVIAYLARSDESGKFRRMMVGAFTDLKMQSWITIFRVAVKNFVWPFQRYGVVGCAVAVLYWPLAIPFSLFMFFFFCLPAVYMTTRMIYHSQSALRNKIVKRKKGRSLYRIEKRVDDTASYFDIFNLHNRCTGRKDTDDDIASMSTVSRGTITSRRSRLSSTSTSAMSAISQRVRKHSGQVWQIILHVTACVLLVVTMYSILFLLSECIGCVVEIVTFTLMGIIINAGAVLKYVMLLFLVLLYCYDTFNNVPKKYLKLNKAIFNEVKGRCKDLDKVTSLPSSLQVNFGFKSQELGEQAEYESPDDIYKRQPRHWLINDLTLFVDNEDFPRIPNRLFDDVCQIRVAGSPGPVWRALVDAFKDLLKIVCFLLFVFIIVLSFGFVYKVSSTNQMLATAAGGFLPFILKTFMAPSRPDIEIGTVSFKSKMDEIIKNFYQVWPIFDLPFDQLTPEEIEELEKEEEEKKGGKKDDKEENKAEEEEVPVEVQMDNKPLDQQPETALTRKDSKPPTYDDAKRDSLYPVVGNRHPTVNPKDLNQNEHNRIEPDKTGLPEKSSLKSSNQDLKRLPSQTSDVGVTFKDKPHKEKPPMKRQQSRHITGLETYPLIEIKDGDPDVLVDLLIFLPENKSDEWLDEWSDFEDYLDPVLSEDDINEETFLRAELKDNNAIDVV